MTDVTRTHVFLCGGPPTAADLERVAVFALFLEDRGACDDGDLPHAVLVRRWEAYAEGAAQGPLCGPWPEETADA